MKAPTYHVLFALIAFNNWDCYHVDLETAFLNSSMLDKKEIFLPQPHGFEELARDGSPLVCRLQRTLYGLKQLPHYCYGTL